MKKTLLKTAAIIALGFSMNACTKPSTNNTTTPPTPSFTASINGTSTTFTGTASLGSVYMTITGTDGSSYTIKIYDKLPIQVGTPVTLGASGGTYATVATGAGQFWSTSATSTGTLTITTYDTSNKLITGTFSFNATGSSNLSVTSGSFANISF